MSTSEFLLSVIIPCYNCEKYIEESVESLHLDLYKNIQVILIDDGSDDNTFEKGKLLSRKYKNLEILHISNSGVSHARNVGLDYAKGAWIMFLDADDTVSSEYFEILKQNSSLDGIDFIRFGICCNYFDNNDKMIKKEKRCFSSFKNDEISYKDFKIHKDFKVLFIDNVFDSACGAFYKLDVIRKNSIHFNETMAVREDSVFVLDFVSNVKSVRVVNKYIYNYRINNSSIYHYRRKIPVKTIKELYSCYLRFLKEDESSLDEDLKQMIIHHVFQQLIGGIIHYSSKLYDESFFSLYRYIKEMSIEFSSMLNEVKYNNLFYKILVFMLRKRCFIGSSIICKLRYNNL